MSWTHQYEMFSHYNLLIKSALSIQKYSIVLQKKGVTPWLVLLKYFCGEKNSIILPKLPAGLPLLGLTFGDTGPVVVAAPVAASSASACFSD